MKLLNAFVSPYAARVRLAIYAYDLPVEIAPSGQWTENYEKSPDYLAINPIGRVPTLILGDGSALPESGVIIEYLADAFPATGLRPGNAEATAKVRLLAQLADLYVQMPSGPLFGQLFSGQRDPGRIAGCLGGMDQGLGYLDHFIGREIIGPDHAITIADCTLVPVLLFAELMAATFEGPPIIAKHPAIASYWHDIRALPVTGKLIDEMRAAIANSPLRALVSRQEQS